MDGIITCLKQVVLQLKSAKLSTLPQFNFKRNN